MCIYIIFDLNSHLGRIQHTCSESVIIIIIRKQTNKQTNKKQTNKHKKEEMKQNKQKTEQNKKKSNIN